MRRFCDSLEINLHNNQPYTLSLLVHPFNLPLSVSLSLARSSDCQLHTVFKLSAYKAHSSMHSTVQCNYKFSLRFWFVKDKKKTNAPNGGRHFQVNSKYYTKNVEYYILLLLLFSPYRGYVYLCAINDTLEDMERKREKEKSGVESTGKRRRRRSAQRWEVWETSIILVCIKQIKGTEKRRQIQGAVTTHTHTHMPRALSTLRSI